MDKLTVHEYFEYPETVRPMELRTHGVEVIALQSTTPARMFRGPDRLRSSVLPDWDIPVVEIFFP